MSAISELLLNLPDRQLPARHSDEYIKFAQSDGFFHLGVVKDRRIARLREGFSKTGLRKIYLSASLGALDCGIEDVEVEVLAKDFFQNSDAARYANNKAQLDGCVVVINNNDVVAPEVGSLYGRFFTDCVTTCFIVWDFDNHHWLGLSTFLAAHSDIYAPAHHENLCLLSRYNSLIVGPVYCSSIQWPREFLAGKSDQILMADRSDAPLGMHIPYPKFGFRNKVIDTLKQHHSSIGFSSRDYHLRTKEQRLREWCSHQAHWVVPVLNDVPIRIFDALVTGGIPIVPNSLRFLAPVDKIPREYMAFYSADDILNPKRVVEHANRLFVEGGQDGIIARHRFALEQHHGDARLGQMLGYAAEVLQL